MNQAVESEIIIRSWDDPTLQYSVKDAETFHRVYGENSRFYIASGPDMDQSLQDHFAALTPNLPRDDEASEKGVETTPDTPNEASPEGASTAGVDSADAPGTPEHTAAHASDAPETGSPEF
jgi:hypothetical protein